MSAGIEVKEFKHIPGKNDAEYIQKLEELREIDKGIISTAVAKIKELSAQQNRKTGEWNKIHWKAFRCSECNRISEYSTNFCPNCGADMRGEEHNADISKKVDD